MRALFSSIPIFLVTTAILTEAQFPDRVYPIPELTDEMRSRIDVKDVSVDDWAEVLGEPTLTPLDLRTPSWTSEYDPSSLDFRIWLAWHDGGNHLFVATELIDDVVNEHVYDRNGPFPHDISHGDLTVWFFVDGDRSGGSYVAEDHPYPMQQAQWYDAFPGTYTNHSNDTNIILSRVSDLADWVHLPPYADGGGGMTDSNPVFGVVEFYVTPFDRLIWDDQEQSIVSDLFPGKTIGFGYQLVDVDENRNAFESIHGLYGPDSEFELDSSDFLAQGFLLGPEGPPKDSAVNDISWGRIKASLSE